MIYENKKRIIFGILFCERDIMQQDFIKPLEEPKDKRTAIDKALKKIVKNEIKRILLINPPQLQTSYIDVDTFKNKRYFNYPPYGLGLLRKFLIEKNYNVKILDLNFELLFLVDCFSKEPKKLKLYMDKFKAEGNSNNKYYNSLQSIPVADLMIPKLDEVLKSYKPAVPIISIGNIEYGGTGKTPFTYYLSEKLLSMGFKPGIVSRGYKRESSKGIIISNKNWNSVRVNDVGDEPFMLSRMLPNVPISVNNNKKLGVIELNNNYNLDVIILDDGFQYRKLHRNIDLVMIKNIESGVYLREFKSSLGRANIIATHSIHKTKEYLSKNKIKLPSFISLETSFSLDKKIADGSISFIDENDFQFPNCCVGVCGIANPKTFKNAVINYKTQSGNINMPKLLAFKDHQNYKKQDVERIKNTLKKLKCNTLITTEKDIYKLLQTELINLDIQIFILSMSIKIEDDSLLVDMLNQVIK